LLCVFLLIVALLQLFVIELEKQLEEKKKQTKALLDVCIQQVWLPLALQP